MNIPNDKPFIRKKNSKSYSWELAGWDKKMYLDRLDLSGIKY